MKKIYLDNAATRLPLASVIETMSRYMHQHFGNPSSIHSIGRDASVAVEKSRKKIADMIGASTSQLFFTSSATESINTAILGAILSWNIKTFITSPIEHPAVLQTLTFYKNIFHLEIKYIAINSNGQIDVDSLENVLSANKNDSTCVILMQVNNELGNITDIQQAGNLCKQYNAKLICDMVQSMGICDVVLSTLPLDIAIFSAHKIGGPKGVGLLYINSEKPIAPLLHGGSQERNMRAGTENVAAIVGFAEAVEWSFKNISSTITHFSTLRNMLLQELQQGFRDIIVNTDITKSSPKILNIGFPVNTKTEMLLYHLDIENICVSSGSACSSGTHVMSHVIQHLPTNMQQVPLRFSFSEDNTLEEIKYTADVLKRILR